MRKQMTAFRFRPVPQPFLPERTPGATWLRSLLTLLLVVAGSTGLWAQQSGDFPEKPTPLQPVNDYAHVLSASEVSQLDQRLRQYDRESSTSIIIVTVPSIGSYDIAQYATELGNRWQIGRAGKNNGVVVLAAINDHKITISVGRGLEGALTDLTSGKIIRREITPSFKQANYYEGFSRGADAIIKATKGEYTNDDPEEGKGGGLSIRAIILVLIIFIVFTRFMGGKGGGGSGGGGYMSRRGSRGWVPPIIIGGGGWGGGDDNNG
ncbi:MAG: TPM domain-containing protein, partial [Sphingobacteriales bacterium]